MIGKLKGIIDSIADDHLILDVGGVGYLVFASHRTLANCEVGAALQLIIETHVREDHIHLYGFAATLEREAFRMLTSVQGVGVRMALAIQGQFATQELQTIIAAQDKKLMTAVSGVGPKLAERIITELKNKVAQLPVGATVADMPKLSSSATKVAAITPAVNSDVEDAVSALVNLGYGRAEAFSAVAKAQASGEAEVDALIKAGLKELSF